MAGLLAHWDLRGIYYVDTVLFLLLALGLAPGTFSARATETPAAVAAPSEAPAAPTTKGGSIG